MVGYFHQDWTIDGGTPEEIIRRFAQEAEPHALVQAHEVTLELLRRFSDEAKLRSQIERLGTGFYPPGINMTYRGWLELVASELSRARVTRESPL